MRLNDDFDEVMAGMDPKDTDPEVKFSRRIEVFKTHQRLFYFVDNIKILNLQPIVIKMCSTLNHKNNGFHCLHLTS